MATWKWCLLPLQQSGLTNETPSHMLRSWNFHAMRSLCALWQGWPGMVFDPGRMCFWDTPIYREGG